MKIFSYLALGDSYTIGEQVPLAESFPYQTVQLLRKMELKEDNLQTAVGVANPRHGLAAPEIIAKTGWTTDELTAAIGQTIFLPTYDMVSLLIGVNNQYRGRPVAEFENEFALLIQMAIQFAGGLASNVYVLSIPDWGVTPFAKDRDTEKIAKEIDDYNKVCEKSAAEFKTHFIDITSHQRLDGNKADFLAADGLHPSGKEYRKWAESLSRLVLAG